MKFRPLGATGIHVSELALGCSSLGASVFSSDEAGSRRLLEAAFDAGINFFDTAGSYAYGRSEALLGEVFGHRRDKVVIATKAGFLPSSLARVGRFLVPVLGQARKWLAPHKRRIQGMSKRRQDFSTPHLNASVDESLRRLRSDYVDLFQLHSPPAPILERDEIFDALERLRSQGKIRHYGVSAGTTEEARMCLARRDVATVQVAFNLLDREAETTLFSSPNMHGIGVLARMPFARGVLTSYVQVRTGGHTVDAAALERTRKRVQEVSGKLGGRPYLTEAALRFVLAHPQVASVIAGTTSERHLLANIEALDAPQLSPSDMKLVADAFSDISLRV